MLQSTKSNHAEQNLQMFLKALLKTTQVHV